MSFFILTALFIWTCLNSYVFWRLIGLSVIASSVSSWSAWSVAVVCWVSLPASRWLLRFGFPSVSAIVEVFAMTWLGVLFLFFVCFLAIDGVTLGGLFLSARAPQFRTIAAALALALSAIAIFQGTRDPVVNEQEVTLPGLPRERDGVRIVFVSDFHLGTQIGKIWLRRLTARIAALSPDAILIGGDVVDHDLQRVRGMIPELRELHAPLGVWAVLGNHDSFESAAESSLILRDAGFRVLHDESELVVSGLRVAGVDDLGLRARFGAVDLAIGSALKSVQIGREGCVFLSHTPVGMVAAAEAGAGLMLCGHTHGGQIWPFNYLVKSRFPELVGRHIFAPMTLIISRGAGTWGPRMRLWKRGEIVLITLRAP